VSWYQKGKIYLDLLEQEIMIGSSIKWVIHKAALPLLRQITTPLSFLQAGCPYCHPTNSIKALKAKLELFSQ